MPNCSIVADSTSSSAIHLQGSASIIADTLVTAGGVATTGNPSFTLNKPAHTNAPVVPDPYASNAHPHVSDYGNAGELYTPSDTRRAA